MIAILIHRDNKTDKVQETDIGILAYNCWYCQKHPAGIRAISRRATRSLEPVGRQSKYAVTDILQCCTVHQATFVVLVMGKWIRIDSHR